MYKRHKMIINYLFFGVATTLVNWIVYSLVVAKIGLGVNTGNIIAWTVAVIFSFFTNKIWVFDSKRWDPIIVLKEGVAYVGGRLVSGAFEIVAFPLLLKAGVDQSLFGIDGIVAKMLVSIVVMVLNYVFSRWVVFRKKTSGVGEQ